ncbi:OLC1v1024585C1 [Oldenlandia corymbosa var. corymbosa]|uniref:OLC1v1024585C1 n=1 Tax=Oldenlandia corymbosa var. corymbosa TaxID=529605 RepID=A0AAV1C3H8_OLDCO|nr:OLC1v1024585C1 [Oldenlandia corymbosa var. corymbosa]
MFHLQVSKRFLPILKSKKQSTHENPNSTGNMVKSSSVIRLLFLLFITVSIQALFIVLKIRDSGGRGSQQQLQRSAGNFPAERKGCENGLVYMYELPPMFNKELLDKCDELDPWGSRCPAVSNNGLGPRATNLAGVVPANLTPAWYQTDKYTSEVIYHARMMDYECRTEVLEEATAFYVPFYPGLAIWKYLNSNYTAKDRDRPAEMLLDWLQSQPSWRKRNGADHFLVLGRLTWDFRRSQDSDWGSSLIYMPAMQNVMKIAVERYPWDELEFSVPYPTAFHPRSRSDIEEWQRYIRSRTRKSLFSIVGKPRKNDFGSLLMDNCKTESRSCKFVDCSVKRCSGTEPGVLETYLDSNFCLQPKGDTSTKRAFFDCMVAGSIPVFFSEFSFNGQYEWHLPLIGESYSVFIDSKDVESGKVSIRNRLEEISEEKVRKMRETIIEFLPKILYAESKQGLGNLKDAFEITIERVVKKVRWELKKKPSLLL